MKNWFRKTDKNDKNKPGHHGVPKLKEWLPLSKKTYDAMNTDETPLEDTPDKNVRLEDTPVKTVRPEDTIEIKMPKPKKRFWPFGVKTVRPLNGSTAADGTPKVVWSGKKKKPWSHRKKVIFIVVSTILAAFIGVGAYAYAFYANPLDQFESVAEQAAASATVPNTATQTSQATDGPTPTIDPYDALVASADFSMLDNIVNILLIGVDHADERDSDEWASHGGKQAFHADVMIVLSINTDTNEVSLISLPRDTYAKIPGVDGIYKLNASIDCGGQWPSDEGFLKVCEAAEWMLGGIPVDLYYAVDMGAVKGLVDAIGGVDYDVDISFDIQGRTYEKGFQHMDGQAVLDYLRIRKAAHIVESGQSGDLNRINRQKKMLVAIFEKIKQEDLLTNIPGILSAFEGNLYTNTTPAQTAALAVFAYKVNSEDIAMYSMSGSSKNIFNWNFVITNQTNRLEIIKEVYGYDAPRYTDYMLDAASRLWADMQAEVIADKSNDVLDKVKAILDADAALPIYSPPAAPTATPTATPTAAPPTESTVTPATSSVVSATLSADKTVIDTGDTVMFTVQITNISADAIDSFEVRNAEDGVEATSAGLPAGGSVSVTFSNVFTNSVTKSFSVIGYIGAATETCSTNTVTITVNPTPTPTSTPAPTPTPTVIPGPSGYRQYGDDVWAFYNQVVAERNALFSYATTEEMEAANTQLKADIGTLCSMFSISVPSWRVNYETESNEVYVNFN
ncbi:MAG: LCP family protein [Eubacteriales bacterium]|nr:LCP family protein [Eubacteriales bacterium]